MATHDRPRERRDPARSRAGELARAVEPGERTARTLPLRAELERRFRVELGDIQAYLGARDTLAKLGGTAAADDRSVAFADPAPSLEVVAHEVAHVLQAQNAIGGDPELEAIEAARCAARGEPVVIGAGARGIQLDASKAPAPSAYIDTIQIYDDVGLRLVKLDYLPATTFGKYIAKTYVNPSMNESHTFSSVVINRIENSGVAPASALFSALVLPEKLDPIVSRGLGDFENAPSASHGGVEDGVSWEVTNALVRRLMESIPRVFPYVATSRRGLKYTDPLPDGDAFPVLHPLDRYVARALCNTEISIAPAYYKDFPVDKNLPAPLPERSVNVGPAGKGLWHWLRAYPSDATAQEVAYVVYGRSDFALRLIPFPPLWGFHHSDLADMGPMLRQSIHEFAAKNHPQPAMLNFAEVHSHREIVYPHRQFQNCGPARGQLPAYDPFLEKPYEPPAPAPIYGLPRGVDPVLELARSEVSTVPPATPKGKLKPQHTFLEVAERYLDAWRAMGQIIASASLLGVDVKQIKEVQDTFRYYRALTVEGFIGPDPDRYYKFITSQVMELGAISYGIADVLSQLAVYGATLPNVPKVDRNLITTLPEAVRAPLQEAARAFVEAAQAIDLPEVAKARKLVAIQLGRDITIKTLEGGLRSAQRGGDEQYDLSNQGPDKGYISPRDILYGAYTASAQLGMLRVQQISDAPGAFAQLQAIGSKIGDLQFDVAVLAAANQLDAYWNALSEGDDFWIGLGDKIRSDQLQAENRKLYETFHSNVYDKYKQGNDKEKAAAREEFIKLTKKDGELDKHFAAIRKLLADEAKHKRWTKLIVAIAIMVISFGVGAEVGVIAIEAWGWGATAATALGAVADFGVASLLNYAAFRQTPTLGGAVTQLVSFGTMSVFQRMRSAARAIGVAAEAEEAVKVTLAAKIANKAVDLTKETFLNATIGFAGNKLAERIDTGRWTNPQDGNEALVDGAITAVAMTIAGRLHGAIMTPRLQKLAVAHGLDYAEVMAERSRLVDEVTKLKDSQDRNKALDAVERMNENFKREQEILKRLKGLMELNPKAYKDAMEELTKYQQLNAQGIKETGQASAIIGAEDVGPGLVRADPRSIDAIVAQHVSEGGRVADVWTDTDTGMRTIVVQPAKGGPIEIRERPPTAQEHARPPRVPREAANEFERWLWSQTDPVLAQRLRALYVADPEAAIAAARKDHGYPGKGAERVAADDPHRGRDDARKLDDPEVRSLTNPDFSAIERAGYRFDPVKRRFVPTGTKSGLKPDTHLTGRNNEVVGMRLPSLAVGHVVLSMLAMGDVHALRVVGIEPPPGFRSESTEWGLGRRKSTGEIVLVRGEELGVVWGSLHDIEPLAHTHPYGESKYFQIGGKAEGRVSIKDLTEGKAPNERQKIFPSGADLVFCALHGLDVHFVYTPYVLFADGTIGNPRPGGLETPITIEIRGAKIVGAERGTGTTTALGEVIVRAGDQELIRKPLYGGDSGGAYQPIGFTQPADLIPVTPGAKPTSTPAPTIIDPERLRVAAENLPPDLHTLVFGDQNVARALHNLGYDADGLTRAWEDFNKQRSPSKALKAKDFGEYLLNSNKYKAADRVVAPPKPVTEVIPDWDALNRRERQHAVVAAAEPDLAAALASPTDTRLPASVKAEINKLLDSTDVLKKPADWDDARHNVMTEIDKLVIGAATTPKELASILGLYKSGGRLGKLGEQYVTSQRPKGVDLVQGEFPAAQIPGLQEVEKFKPDRILRGKGISMDVKTGYETSGFDTVQAHNYDAFITATRTNQALADLIGGALDGHRYLVLPRGSADTLAIAKREYETLQGLGLKHDTRVWYVGEGGVFEFHPDKSTYLGATVGEAIAKLPDKK